MNNRSRKACTILGASLLFPSVSIATEPCPPFPCFDSALKLQAQQCYQHANWVAVGAIEDVKHDRQGYPLNKDFASFTFRVIAVEKGTPPADRLRFTVGWCENPQELPSRLTGEFRFYGSNSPDPATAAAQYYAFEPVKGSAKLNPFEKQPFSQ